MADLDHFKNVNDRYGHAAGDSALRLAAGLVTQEVRRLDVCTRVGGEEFAGDHAQHRSVRRHGGGAPNSQVTAGPGLPERPPPPAAGSTPGDNPGHGQLRPLLLPEPGGGGRRAPLPAGRRRHVPGQGRGPQPHLPGRRSTRGRRRLPPTSATSCTSFLCSPGWPPCSRVLPRAVPARRTHGVFQTEICFATR